MIKDLLDLPSAHTHSLSRTNSVEDFCKWTKSPEALADGIDQIHMTSMKWGKTPGTPSHEFLILTTNTTVAFRIERDTDSWSTVFGPRRTSKSIDTITISNNAYDLMVHEDHIIARLTINQSHHPRTQISLIGLLLEITVTCAPSYNVHTFNCWWFSGRLWSNIAKSIPQEVSEFHLDEHSRSMVGIEKNGSGSRRWTAVEFAHTQQILHLNGLQRFYGNKVTQLAKKEVELVSALIDAQFDLVLQQRVRADLEERLAASENTRLGLDKQLTAAKLATKQVMRYRQEAYKTLENKWKESDGKRAEMVKKVEERMKAEEEMRKEVEEAKMALAECRWQSEEARRTFELSKNRLDILLEDRESVIERLRLENEGLRRVMEDRRVGSRSLGQMNGNGTPDHPTLELQRSDTMSSNVTLVEPSPTPTPSPSPSTPRRKGSPYATADDMAQSRGRVTGVQRSANVETPRPKSPIAKPSTLDASAQVSTKYADAVKNAGKISQRSTLSNNGRLLVPPRDERSVGRNRSVSKDGRQREVIPVAKRRSWA